MGHYDTDVHCLGCDTYLYSYLHDSERLSDTHSICASCRARGVTASDVYYRRGMEAGIKAEKERRQREAAEIVRRAQEAEDWKGSGI